MNKHTAVILLVLALTGCATSRKATEKDNAEKTENAVVAPRGRDTMFVRGTVFSPVTMKSRIFLDGNDGRQYVATHYFPDDVIFSEPGDTVVYDRGQHKIIDNLRLARQAKSFVRER